MCVCAVCIDCCKNVWILYVMLWLCVAEEAKPKPMGCKYNMYICMEWWPRFLYNIIYIWPKYVGENVGAHRKHRKYYIIYNIYTWCPSIWWDCTWEELLQSNLVGMKRWTWGAIRGFRDTINSKGKVKESRRRNGRKKAWWQQGDWEEMEGKLRENYV